MTERAGGAMSTEQDQRIHEQTSLTPAERLQFMNGLIDQHRSITNAAEYISGLARPIWAEVQHVGLDQYCHEICAGVPYGAVDEKLVNELQARGLDVPADMRCDIYAYLHLTWRMLPGRPSILSRLVEQRSARELVSIRSLVLPGTDPNPMKPTTVIESHEATMVPAVNSLLGARYSDEGLVELHRRMPALQEIDLSYMAEHLRAVRKHERKFQRYLYYDQSLPV